MLHKSRQDSEDFTLREIGALGEKLFGDRANLFIDTRTGICYVGRFLDRLHLAAKRAAWLRPQVIYAAGRTFREAFHALGVDRKIISIPGAAPSMTMTAYQPDFDPRTGAIRGFRTTGGLRIRQIPIAGQTELIERGALVV